MNIFELTRALIDIDSVTPHEHAVGNFWFDYLSTLAARTGGRVERMPVVDGRFNVLATWDQPIVTFSTHIDTVPPFFPSREDDEFVWGRGACDTKGIQAAMIFSIEALLAEDVRNLALLLVVDEERDSAGASEASKHPRGSKFLINGEPTDNRLAVGSKGALRYEIVAKGKMAHSAYPHLGESAIEKLLDALAQIRNLPLPHDEVFGPCTLNIGTIQGGRAPNVIPDHAQAEIFFRLVDDGSSLQEKMQSMSGLVEVREIRCAPAVKFATLPGFETFVAAFMTDIPAFEGAWGEPFLIGPGSVHVAHTDREHIAKNEILEAVEIYKQMTKRLMK